jgi:hypothetical protein
VVAPFKFEIGVYHSTLASTSTEFLTVCLPNVAWSQKTELPTLGDLSSVAWQSNTLVLLGVPPRCGSAQCLQLIKDAKHDLVWLGLDTHSDDVTLRLLCSVLGQRLNAQPSTSVLLAFGACSRSVGINILTPICAKLAPITLANWMLALPDKMPLNLVCMPGSHDACMYVAQHSKTTSSSNTLTQFFTIAEQLRLGTRFFDIRVYLDEGTLRAGHLVSKSASWHAGCFGPKLEHVLEDLESFVACYTSEVVIIKVDISGDAERLALARFKSMKRSCVFESLRPLQLAEVTLAGLRGRIVLVLTNLSAVVDSGCNFLHAYSKDADATASFAKSCLLVQGEAPTANTLSEVLETQLALPFNCTAPYLAMRYLTITASGFDVLKRAGTIAKNTAKQFGLELQKHDREKLAGRSDYEGWVDESQAAQQYGAAIHKLGAANIYMYDFVCYSVNEWIICMNQSIRDAL